MLTLVSSFLSPDGDEARRWAEDELSRAKYAEPGQSLIERVGTKVLEWLARLDIEIGAGASRAGSITIILLIAVIAVAAIMYGRLRPAARRARVRAGMILDDDRTASALVADARAAQSRGDFGAACVDYYRACIRILDSRGLIFATPGMTAREAAQHGVAATGLPLGLGAGVFDAVMYGGGTASADDARFLADLVGRCRSADRAAV